VFVLTRDEHGELDSRRRDLRIVLARCDGTCKGRFRVLPSDVLPHKHYGLAVISSLAKATVLGNKSLRVAAWSQYEGQTPQHSTLHAWTEGLGAYVLGRGSGSQAGDHSFTAIMAEVRSRWSQLGAPASPPIDPSRYRSEARRERLAAVATALAVASMVVRAAEVVVSDTSTPLCALRQLAVRFGMTSPFSFRTGLSCTRIEHRDRRDGEASGLSPKTGGLSCPTRTRSPPGDSNR
jgi:hypothetical protein